jgi:TPP-dependent trihydroxycyclohexane-1,2-dione (THcHDO) dehydratase
VGGSPAFGRIRVVPIRTTRAPFVAERRGERLMETIRLTTAQALVRFLANRYSERDGREQRLIPGVWGIFGHGNAAGIGQALLQAATTGEADLPYCLARNEQGMVRVAPAGPERLGVRRRVRARAVLSVRKR